MSKAPKTANIEALAKGFKVNRVIPVGKMIFRPGSTYLDVKPEIITKLVEAGAISDEAV